MKLKTILNAYRASEDAHRFAVLNYTYWENSVLLKYIYNYERKKEAFWERIIKMVDALDKQEKAS